MRTALIVLCAAFVIVVGVSLLPTARLPEWPTPIPHPPSASTEPISALASAERPPVLAGTSQVSDSRFSGLSSPSWMRPDLQPRAPLSALLPAEFADQRHVKITLMSFVRTCKWNELHARNEREAKEARAQGLRQTPAEQRSALDKSRLAELETGPILAPMQVGCRSSTAATPLQRYAEEVLDPTPFRSGLTKVEGQAWDAIMQEETGIFASVYDLKCAESVVQYLDATAAIQRAFERKLAKIRNTHEYRVAEKAWTESMSR